MTTNRVPALPMSALIDVQAARHPDAVAVSASGGSATYRELEERANQVAASLASRRVGRGDLVAICAAPSFGSIAAILGIWKAGAAYVALHPGQPPVRLAGRLAETGARVCFVDDDFAGTSFSGGAEVLRLSSFPERDPAKNVDFPEPSPGDLAYALFVPGSAGKAKLVGIPHSSLVGHTMFVWQNLLGGEEGLRFSTPPSLAADPGHTCLFAALASAGRLEIPGEKTSGDDAVLARLLGDRRIGIRKIEIVAGKRRVGAAVA